MNKILGWVLIVVLGFISLSGITTLITSLPTLTTSDGAYVLGSLMGSAIVIYLPYWIITRKLLPKVKKTNRTKN